MPRTGPRPRKIEVFKDHAGEWRWHLKAGNGKVVADSGEGYGRRDTAVRRAEKALPGVLVVVLPA